MVSVSPLALSSLAYMRYMRRDERTVLSSIRMYTNTYKTTKIKANRKNETSSKLLMLLKRFGIVKVGLFGFLLFKYTILYILYTYTKKRLRFL